MLLAIPSSHLLLLWSSLLAATPGPNKDAAQRLSKQRKAHSRIQGFVLLRSSSSAPFLVLLCPSIIPTRIALFLRLVGTACMQVNGKRSLNCRV